MSSSREAFAEWAFGLELGRDADGRYMHRATRDAWLAWQAATERAAQIVQSEGPVIGSSGVAIVAAKIKGDSQ